MKVTVSVPGKIHLMGEHAVVYGKPALLTAINKRLYVTVETGREGITSPDPKISEHVAFIVELIKREMKLAEIPPLSITVTSQMPFGYHLGSSAAIAVATVAAVIYAVKKLWNPMTINQLAYEAEKKQHGNPSGGDNTVVTFGGFLWYRKELEFLKSMWQLPFQPHKSLAHFFLINTGKPQETTGEMVALVKSKMENGKSKMEKQLNINEEQTRRLAVALKEGKETELLEAIRLGERTLEELGVVSPKVKKLIREIEEQGGAAKILGGGGKTDGVGFVLCYHHDPKAIETVCVPYGFTIDHITLCEEGVRLETGKY